MTAHIELDFDAESNTVTMTGKSTKDGDVTQRTVYLKDGAYGIVEVASGNDDTKLHGIIVGDIETIRRMLNPFAEWAS